MTAMIDNRRYPVGIQTFSEIIRGGYIYVDKTDLLWHMQDYAKFIFLSRPRRFGKSLLSSTLHSYFAGERNLFQELKIMQLEKEWKQYPVLHLDMSLLKSKDNAEELSRSLRLHLSRINQFGENPLEVTPGEMLEGMIRRAYQQSGMQVAVIVDEYDAPLLEVLHENKNLEDMRKVMQELYQPLKACESMIKFCFITGITKFSQLSIFSTLNNLTNISLLPEFSAICGITEQEVTTVFAEDIHRLGELFGCSDDEMFLRIKNSYDGYHFASRSEDIYNPYSLLNAFKNGELNNYWFATGTPTFLIRKMKELQTDITSMDDIEAPSSAFDQPTENMHDALPLLYQSGYLTIKEFDVESQIYTLSIPNKEVRVGFADGLLPAYTGLKGSEVQTGFALKFWRALKQNDVELALREMQSYLAGIPFVEGFKQKLKDAATAEGFYEYTLYLIFSMLNTYVKTQVKCAGGRIDMVVYMPDTIYILELKTRGTAEEALKQIVDKGYAAPFMTENRKVVKVGLKFDVSNRTLENWVIEE